MRDEIAYIRASLGDLTQSQMRIQLDIAGIKGSQTSMEGDLLTHIKRTELAEEAIELLRQEVKPISTHVAILSVLTKLLLLAGSIVGIAVGVLRLMER
jgi:hypothetical protein